MARILVIDDSVSVALSVRSMLAADGHRVERLASFVELARHLRDYPPDVILLDLEMPGFPGVNVGAFLRKYEKRRWPIIVHSSRPREELKAAAIAIGAQGWFEKGGPPHELRRLIQDAVAERVSG